MRKDLANRVPYPPGETSFSMARTRRFAKEPLGLLGLDGAKLRAGVTTIRVHRTAMWCSCWGRPQAHYMTVSPRLELHVAGVTLPAT